MLPLALALASCSSDPPEEATGVVFTTTTQPLGPGGYGTEPITDPGSPATEDPGCAPAAEVVLNEVSPANSTTLVDAEGESVDWLELYNAGPTPVDLAGWTLSDDPDEPQRWTFPSLSLDPGAFVVVYPSEKDSARIVGRWETRVDQGHLWRYLAVTAPVDPAWPKPGYDDSGWASGPSGFGVGDADDATVVNADTLYVRTEIELTAAEVADLADLALHVDFDDGFVAYLNGVEVARVGLGGGGPPAWDALASAHEAALYQGLPPAYFDLRASLDLLHEGSNTLALEVHNSATDSSDLTLIPFLSLGFSSPGEDQVASVLELSKVDLHTNFALRSTEAVRLFDPAGCRADELDPPEPLRADESYGRQPDGTGGLGYFLAPTPGGPNLTESRPGFAATPVFDPPPGYWPDGAPIALTADPDADVHYTWGGWEPSQDDARYVEPLEPASTGEAVVLRARAWKDGLWPSRIATGTWLLRAPGELPVVSLTTDPPNLWDEETGIYVLGPTYDPAQPYYGANFWQPWEKPVHVELWEPDGTEGFSVDAGFGIHGGWSRAHEQRSFLVKMRSAYGEDELDYEVFPDLGVDEFGELLIRASGTDWIGCSMPGCTEGAMLRDPLLHTLTAGTDLDVMAYRPVEVYLNGEYWGLYSLRERPSPDWVERHHEQEDIDLIEVARVVKGDAAHFEDTLAFLRTHDLSDPESYAEIEGRIDVEELATYLAVEVYSGNTDWPQNNLRYWRPRVDGGRWRWLLYDTDWGFGRFYAKPWEDTLARVLDPAEPHSEVFRLLLGSPQFRALFVNTYADLLNTLFTPESVRPVFYAQRDEIAPDMPRHLDRFGTWTDGVVSWALPAGVWEDELDWMDGWIGDRPDHAREHLLTNLDLDGTYTLTLEADPPGSATFELTAVTVEDPFSGTYFRGVPVTVTAHPAPGYTFAGWGDPALPSGSTVTIDAEGPTVVVARFEPVVLPADPPDPAASPSPPAVRRSRGCQ